MTNEQILEKVMDFHDLSESGDSELRDRTAKAQNFIIGEQWDPEVRRINNEDGKFTLTIPLCMAIVEQLAGTEIQNPRDVKVNANRGGSKAGAQVLTALVKHALDTEQGRYEFSQYFKEGTGSGQGYMGLSLEESTDPRHKDIRIEKLNSGYVRRDPNCSVYDINAKGGAEFIIYEPWEPISWIEKKWPKGKEAIAKGTGGGSVIDWMVNFGRKAVSLFGLLGTDAQTIAERRQQVRHTYWREWEEGVYRYDSKKSELDAVLLIPGAYATINDETKKVTSGLIAREKTRALEEPDISIETVLCPVLHHAVTMNDELLDHKADELRIAETGRFYYPITPYYAYFVNGYIYGVVKNLISLQEEINWTRSEFLNIVKQLANTGWITGNSNYNDFLEEHSGENGVILDRSKAGGFLEKIQPNAPPAGHALDAAMSKEDLKTVSNVRTEDPSVNKQEGWQAIRLKQQASATGSASLFSNYEHSRVIFANMVVEVIRHSGVYSEDEIREIVDKADLVDSTLMDQAAERLAEQGVKPPEEPQVQDPRNMPEFSQATPEAQNQAVTNVVQTYQQSMQDYQQKMQAYQTVVRNLAEKLVFAEIEHIRRGRYNSTVSLSSSAPTVRLGKFSSLLELHEYLVNSGQPGIARDDLIKASDVDNPEELIANVPATAAASVKGAA